MALLFAIGVTAAVFALAFGLVWVLSRRDKGGTGTGEGVPFVITDGGM